MSTWLTYATELITGKIDAVRSYLTRTKNKLVDYGSYIKQNSVYAIRFVRGQNIYTGVSTAKLVRRVKENLKEPINNFNNLLNLDVEEEKFTDEELKCINYHQPRGSSVYTIVDRTKNKVKVIKSE